MSGFIAREENVIEWGRFLEDGGEHLAADFYLELSANLIKDAKKASKKIAKHFSGSCDMNIENEHIVFQVDRSELPWIEKAADLAVVIHRIKIDCSHIFRVDPSKIKVTQHVHLLDD